MNKSGVNVHRIANALLVVGAVALLISSSVRTTVVSTLQRGLLQTGLMNAEAEVSHRWGTVNRALALETLDGIPLDLTNLVGKPVFLHFWASWCPPCVAELPDIRRLMQSMSAEEVVFLLVTVEEDVDKERRFLRKNNHTDLPVYRRAGPLPTDLSHRVVPTTYVIDPSGDIVYRHEGLAQYNHRGFKQFLRSCCLQAAATERFANAPVSED